MVVMRQQDILRQAMVQSGQTRAQLAEVMGVAKRTLDKWLLPDASHDFRRMPETALRLLANQYGVRKTADLSMPYDWSDPAIRDEALILNVLRRAHFPDLVRLCADYGLDKVRARTDTAVALAPVAERDILSRILARMLRSIEIAMTEHAVFRQSCRAAFCFRHSNHRRLALRPDGSTDTVRHEKRPAAQALTLTRLLRSDVVLPAP